jgi:hypothetical protein
MLLRKLTCLLVPAILAASLAPRGSAQPAPALNPRFAFSDTTLLRDTLGIQFGRLFELADSLQMTPDTLRALSVRLGFPPSRMIFLADSLHTKVDSVGVWLERERFNPLAAASQGAGRTNTFSYSSSYNVQQARSTWGNVSDYTFGWGQFYLRNGATIQMNRFESSRKTTIQETRTSTTEAGLKLSQDYSIGGRAVLNRADSDDPSSIGTVRRRQGDYQLSMRTKQQPRPGITSELNVFSGLLDLSSNRLEKHGLTGEVNGRFRHESGHWFVHELSGQANGNYTRTLVPTTGLGQRTRDALGGVNGTLNLFDQAPLGFNGTYALQRSRANTPDDKGVFRIVRSVGTDLNGTVRAAIGTRGLFHVGGVYSLADQVTELNGPSNRHGTTILADGRYEILGNVLESNFQTSFTRSDIPQADTTGGYGEDLTDRSLSGGITRSLFGRVNARANARIGLTRYRSRIFGNYDTPPTPRDLVTQNYRVEANYAGTADFSTGISLDVTRAQTVNLPSASTSANNTQRTYRGEWRWTYRLLRGLTATQRNTLGATYTAYNFVPENDRLGLEFGTATTLNAILTPRLTVDLTHTSRLTPGGNYLRQSDGLYYFQQGDRTTLYSLESRISYTPIPGFSLQLQPSFQSSRRDGSSGGTLVPQRLDRTLNFFGTSNLNLRVGRKGNLTGTIGRTFLGTSSRTFGAIVEPTLASESSYWNGTLNFSWRL